MFIGDGERLVIEFEKFIIINLTLPASTLAKHRILVILYGSMQTGSIRRTSTVMPRNRGRLQIT